MAISACLLQIIFVNHRLRVRGRPDVMDPMTTGTVGRKGISPLVGKAVKTIVIRFHSEVGQLIFFRYPLCGMALRASRQRNSLLIHGGIGIHLCFYPVDAVAGGTRRGIRPAPGSQRPVDAFGKLLGDIRMARTAGLRNIRPKDGRFRIDEGPQIMASVAARTVHLSCLSMDTLLEFISRNSGTQRMRLDKFNIRMATVAGLIDVGNVDH